MASTMSGGDFFENRDFSRAYTTLKLFPSGPLTGQAAAVNIGAYGARFELDCDLSPLFPYINAVADNARYYEKPVSILDIYRLLPGTNCRTCGYATCMAFAAALSRQRTSMVQCPHLARPVEEKAIFPVYDRQGNVIRTVSLDIDTALLRQEIDQKENHIQSLQSRLSDLEKIRIVDFAAANANLPTPLTRREIQVLQWIACGATNKEISRELKISQHTVKSHVIHIFNKIGVNDRAQASAWGAMHGLQVGEHP